MITQRAVLFGFVGFCFYLIAIVNALPPFYYSLTWLTAGILVSCFGVALLSLFALQCEWSVPGSVVSEWLGSDQTKVLSSGNRPTDSSPDPEGAAGAPGIEIDIANTGTLNKTDIVLEVRLRDRRDNELTRRFLLEALPSGGRLRTRLPLHDLPRGRYRVEEMRLIGSDVLGLFRLRKRIPSKTFAPKTDVVPENIGQDEVVSTDIERDIVVGPAMIAAPEVRAWLQLGGVSGGLDATATLGQGDEVRGTRPYNAGDDLRFVHWKTTARRGELVVREFHRTARNQSVVIWDGARDPTAAAEVATTATAAAATSAAATSAAALGEQLLNRSNLMQAVGRLHGNPRVQSSPRRNRPSVEFSLRVTASLCRTIMESGQPCALLRLDSNPLLIRAIEQGSTSSSALSRISEALADAEANRHTSLTQALAGWMHDMAPGSGLYIITASPTPDLAAAVQVLRAQRSHVAVCVVNLKELVAITSDEGAEQPAQGNATQSTLARSDATAAENMARVEALRATGVSVVIAPRRDTLEERRAIGSSLSAADKPADCEIAAIRMALRELIQGSAQTSVAGTAANTGLINGSGATSTGVDGNQVASG